MHITPYQQAQQKANTTGQKWEVWEHVGDYGRPGGDLPARHTFRVVPFGSTHMGDGWAMVAIAEPETQGS